MYLYLIRSELIIMHLCYHVTQNKGMEISFYVKEERLCILFIKRLRQKTYVTYDVHAAIHRVATWRGRIFS